MAKWRAIHSDISTSEQIDELTLFEKLLFTWMIPHADDWGVITGKPRELILKVIPGIACQCQEVTDALRHMEEVGLLWLYEPDDYGPLVQFRRWDSHQPIREDRRKDPERPLHYEHPCYADFPDLAWKSQEKPGNDGQRRAIQDNTNTIQDNTSPTEKRKRDPRLDHPAIIGYRELARLHVPIALRDDWIARAVFVGTDNLLAVVKEWIGRGYNPRNVQGMMRVAKEGWDDEAHRRRDDGITDEERQIYTLGP